MTGDPDLDLTSTSYVERQNLTMRLGMRRFTRLANAHPKKVENDSRGQPSLHALHLRPAHQTHGRRVTPAMAAGIERHPWSLNAELLD